MMSSFDIDCLTKIGLICADGGHYTELLFMSEAFEGHECFWVTYNSARTQLIKDNKYLFPDFGQNLFNSIININNILKIFIKEKPQLLISTGSEIAIIFFIFARVLNIKTIFIETYTRVKKPSFTAKILYLISNKFIVFWPDLKYKYFIKSTYIKGLFQFNIEKRLNPLEIKKILVIVGMNYRSFDTLIQKMDDIDLNLKYDITIQKGPSIYPIKNAKSFDYLPYSELLNVIRNNDLIICQGAMSIFDALLLDKPVIAIPRRKDEKQVIDDHQYYFVKALRDLEIISSIDNVDGINDAIFNITNTKIVKITVNPELIKELRKNIWLAGSD